MAYNLKNRNFLKLLDFTPKEIGFLQVTDHPLGYPERVMNRDIRPDKIDRLKTILIEGNLFKKVAF